MEPQRIEDLEKKPSEVQLGGVVHVSFLIGSFLFSGIMLLACKDKCEYVRFQIAQALAVQVATMCGVMLYVLLAFCVIGISVVTTVVTKFPPVYLAIFLPLHLAVVFGTLGMNLVLAGVGMIKGFHGDDWSIPLAGKWVFAKFFQGKRAAATQAHISHQ